MFADLSIPYQVWVLVGLAFLVADLAAPGLILSCLGLGCLAAAAVDYAAPAAAALAVQAGAALAGTLFAFLVLRPPLRRAQQRRKERKAEAREARRRPPREPEPVDFFAEKPAPAPRPKARPAPEPGPDEPRDPFAPKPPRKSGDPFAALTPPPAPKRPSAALDMFEEDDERSGFDLLEPVLDDSLRLSIDEEAGSPLLLTDTVEDAPRPQKPLADLDMNLSLDGGGQARPRNPVGRTATALTAIGPFSAGQVELDGLTYKAFSDHNVRPGDKVAVLEQMPDHPEILVVEPRKGGL
jgi:membrane protein implicated in regulation of membrane protease activity